MPNRTKEMLAESLMKLLARRTLDKITIQDIVDDCGYNRQTFYYHFHDIYDLIDWIFAAQTQELIEKCRACGSLDVGVEAVIAYMRENRRLILNILRSVNGEKLLDNLYRSAQSIVLSALENHPGVQELSTEYRGLVAEAFKYALAGLLIDWMRAGIPEDLVNKVRTMKAVYIGALEYALDTVRGLQALNLDIEEDL
ncbi:MAG: TetR/AcrR family transcriptional regulator C-terminal domain-containing protein [Clostridiales bacterium]|nr:TetR/AcrR family transcriptional regulator C-terminal domain-containing protein [Clostridiales bacterium]